MVTMLVLPPARADVVDFLNDRQFDVNVIEPVEGPNASMAARVCAAIRLVDPRPPLVIVACGPAAALLPSVALAQRTSHRLVLGYLLINPELPTVGESWPDAPVCVVSDDDWTSTQVRLRGWELLDAIDEWQPPIT